MIMCRLLPWVLTWWVFFFFKKLPVLTRACCLLFLPYLLNQQRQKDRDSVRKSWSNLTLPFAPVLSLPPSKRSSSPIKKSGKVTAPSPGRSVDITFDKWGIFGAEIEFYSFI